ncbi:hypothetical protein GBAR_LOCUS31023 [Geodia barretti]|uniref:Uncharacterized protein n=1 Tax=Geodia barretti TaxID=519541 RepID=A0AA35XL43_GEOBA|nr:hypothetical protein GBAR_LOCUS31023 [Geodia barretti]
MGRVGGCVTSRLRRLRPTTRTLTGCAVISRSRAKLTRPARRERRRRTSGCWLLRSSAPASSPCCPTPLSTASTSECAPVVGSQRFLRC